MPSGLRIVVSPIPPPDQLSVFKRAQDQQAGRRVIEILDLTVRGHAQHRFRNKISLHHLIDGNLRVGSHYRRGHSLKQDLIAALVGGGACFRRARSSGETLVVWGEEERL